MRPARLFAPALVFALLPGPAAARPAHKQALADHLGPFLARGLNDCRVCHLPDAPDQTADDEKPHNPFGARLAAVRGELRTAGKPSEISNRVQAVAAEDSDGDGSPNLVELLTGHNPGDPKDTPTVAQTAEYPTTLTAFRKFLASYPWRPFDPVRRPAVPEVRNPQFAIRNVVDAFLAIEQIERGLTPRPEAASSVLLRRVYLDLIGLPPTPDEQHAFLADRSPDAFEKVVDRLLASPRYGERWGRHWMDVWRYSDWAGWNQQVRDSQPHIWRWRDWIVDSLIADAPYDRMVREMLAGDEIAPENPDTLRATGYLVRNFKLLSREKWMQDTVDHTFQAFLGVTLGCARCHDHMYDPLTQREYYQVRAVFEPHKVRTDRVPGEPDVKKDGLPRAYDAELSAPTYFYVRGDERTPDKSATIAPGVPARLGGVFPEVKPVPLSATARIPNRRPFVVRERIAESEAKVRRADAAAATVRRALPGAVLLGLSARGVLITPAVVRRAADAANLADLDAGLAKQAHAALLAVIAAEAAEDAHGKGSPEWQAAAEAANAAQRRANVGTARRNVFAAEHGLSPPPAKGQKPPSLTALRQAVADAEAEAAKPPSTAHLWRAGEEFPATSTGRRTALAAWMTAPANPLFARVAVNHIWLRHFGRGLVPTAADFGRNGQRPSHPALLDWLAAEFVARGYSMKAMHRLMVTSAAYRRASTPDDANLAADRDNVFLWRMPSRRLEAELVRDQIFYVAGKLDLTPGGPDIDHARGLTVPRRSLYFRHAAEKQMEFLKLFDCAAVTECYQRKDSIVPQQALALALANSDLTIRHARLLAAELKAPSDAAFVVAAFERVLARPPSGDEVSECVAFLKERTGTRGRENLVHVLMNHHDFVTIR
jgi:hypothetical protein